VSARKYLHTSTRLTASLMFSRVGACSRKMAAKAGVADTTLACGALLSVALSASALAAHSARPWLASASPSEVWLCALSFAPLSSATERAPAGASCVAPAVRANLLTKRAPVK
jgi:hypothetical protein